MTCLRCFTIASLLVAWGCSDATPSSTNAASNGDCETFYAKARECAVLGDGEINCENASADYAQCAANCATQATCTQVTQYACDMSQGTLRDCLNNCPGTSFRGSGVNGGFAPFAPTTVALLCEDQMSSGRVCDGIPDCPDGRDETNCVSFTCSNGVVVPQARTCDGNFDCPDGADEAQCREVSHCDDGSPYFPSDTCDGFPDCADGTDERDCFHCNDGEVFSPSARCNFTAQCDDSSDELGCAEWLCSAPAAGSTL